MDSAAPIVEGHDLKAHCGAIVRHAKVVFMWDEQAMGTMDIRPIPGMCKQCLMTPTSGARRYVYGIVNEPEGYH